jgi:hypothetical protein
VILYSLSCQATGCGTGFESWFSSSQDFERLAKAKMLACPACDSSNVVKGVMAPAVRTTRDQVIGDQNGVHAALRALRRNVEASGENVGQGFADQARRMHDGELPHRTIYGEATSEEAQALHDDGIPVSRIPWVRLDDA